MGVSSAALHRLCRRSHVLRIGGARESGGGSQQVIRNKEKLVGTLTSSEVKRTRELSLKANY